VVRPTDGPALATLFDGCSAETVYRRFFGQPSALPPQYRAAVLGGHPDVHDAVVVRYGDRLHVAGLASLATLRQGAQPAELGVLVVDAWQGRGLGTAMVDALVARARRRATERLTATVLPGRSSLLRALGRRLDLERFTCAADNLTGVFLLARSTGNTLPSAAVPLRR
jgi:GNAT superfamily N-acetyltransferase